MAPKECARGSAPRGILRGAGGAGRDGNTREKYMSPVPSRRYRHQESKDPSKWRRNTRHAHHSTPIPCLQHCLRVGIPFIQCYTVPCAHGFQFAGNGDQHRPRTQVRSKETTKTNVECRQPYWSSILQAGANTVTQCSLTLQHAVASPTNSYPADTGRHPGGFIRCPENACDPRGCGVCRCHRHCRSFRRKRGCFAVSTSDFRVSKLPQTDTKHTRTSQTKFRFRFQVEPLCDKTHPPCRSAQKNHQALSLAHETQNQ